MIKFNELLSSLTVVSSLNLKWIEPYVVKDKKENRVYQISNKVMNEICKILKLNKTLVKKLYEFDQSLWSDMVSIAIGDVDYDPFISSDFICYEGNKLIDIYDEGSGDEFILHRDTFVQGMNGFKFDTIINSNKQIISLCSSEDDKYESILLFTIDFINSVYCVHQGKMMNDKLYLFSKPLADCWNIIDFLASIPSIEDQVKQCDEIIEYMTFNNNPAFLSIRELLDYTKSIGCKDLFNYDDRGIVSDIEYSNPKTVKIKEKIIKNMSSMPYKSLNKLQYLRKSLRDTDMHAQEMLEYMTDNLLNEYFSINGYVIAQICNMIDLGDYDNLIKLSEVRGKQ